MGFNCLKAIEAVYFLSLSSQKFLVLILLTSEGWKAELTLVLNERPLDCGSSALTTGPLFIVILFAINTFTQ